MPSDLQFLLCMIRSMVLQLASILQCVVCSKGLFNERPPLPRYTASWDVQTVIQYLGPSTALPLKFLTFKLVMLLALTRPSCSADLVSLQLDRCHFRPEGVVFLPAALAKQSAQGKPLKEYFFPSFPNNPQLCPVETLKQYEVLTVPLRPNTTTNLFIALVKPHKAESLATIARWLREVGWHRCQYFFWPLS